MKRVMILLAGYPATGKTYLENMIIDSFGEFAVVSQDVLKEKFFDHYGYDDLKEKKMLESESWNSFYSALRIHMYRGEPIISDYPFSGKQHGKLDGLSKLYGYKVITIRLTGDLDVLYERSKKRDLSAKRHPSHLLNKYHLGDELKDRLKADGFLEYDVFIDRCKNNGYGEFQLGHLIEVDVTDFLEVDYSQLIMEIEQFIN
jgi:predicted kinase